jgi:hypothetical protein
MNIKYLLIASDISTAVKFFTNTIGSKTETPVQAAYQRGKFCWVHKISMKIHGISV